MYHWWLCESFRNIDSLTKRRLKCVAPMSITLGKISSRIMIANNNRLFTYKWHKIDPGTNIPNGASRIFHLVLNESTNHRKVQKRKKERKREREGVIVDRSKHSDRPSFCENPLGYCNPGPNRCPRNPCWSQSWRSSDCIGLATMDTAIIPA